MNSTNRTQATGTHAAPPLPAASPPGPRQKGGLVREVLACLASGPKSRAEIRGTVSCRYPDLYKAIGKLVRAGAAAEVGKGRYEAVPGAQTALDDPARLSRVILAFLATPRRIGEVARHAGAPRGTVRSRVDALVCAGQAAKVGPGLYAATGQPRAMPCVPAARPSAPARRRAQPIRDAILAFLGEPRQARDVAAHIGRPVSTATSHLATMRRRGLVVRIAHGRYERAEPAPAPDLARPAAAFVPSPVRHAILAHLSEPRRLKDVAAHIGSSAGSAYSHLHELRRRGLVARIGRGRYQRTHAVAAESPATACAGSVSPRRVA